MPTFLGCDRVDQRLKSNMTTAVVFSFVQGVQTSPASQWHADRQTGVEMPICGLIISVVICSTECVIVCWHGCSFVYQRTCSCMSRVPAIQHVPLSLADSSSHISF